MNLVAPCEPSRLPAIIMWLFGILTVVSAFALAWTGGTSSAAFVLMALGLFGSGISLVVRLDAAQDPASRHGRRAVSSGG